MFATLFLFQLSSPLDEKVARARSWLFVHSITTLKEEKEEKVEFQSSLWRHFQMVLKTRVEEDDEYKMHTVCVFFLQIMQNHFLERS